MESLTREDYLVNMLMTVHTAMNDERAHVGLTDEQWEELSEITGLPHPVKRVYEPYVPNWDEIERLKPEHY